MGAAVENCMKHEDRQTGLTEVVCSSTAVYESPAIASETLTTCNCTRMCCSCSIRTLVPELDATDRDRDPDDH